MFRRTVSAIMFTLLLASMLTLAFNIKPAKASGAVGVKAGDWIKCAYSISGWPSGTPYPEWLKVEFLTVEGTNATVRVTMRMSDGTEQSDTMIVDVVAGGGTFQGLSGFVIPANSTTGDSIYMTGYGNVTVAGETTGTYAGATRTVVYASFSQYGTQLTYRWDKLTGVIVESSVVSGGVAGTAKATETNMWQAEIIYIRADGSIGPPTAPISTMDNVTYTVIGNITDSIVVERDNIVVNGAGHNMTGSRNGNGITLTDRTNVTVRNMVIQNFHYGIWLSNSTSNVVSGNVVLACDYSIQVSESLNNTISQNHIASIEEQGGIRLIYAGIKLDRSSNNTIIQNNVTQCQQAITIEGWMYDGEDASNNTIIENTVDYIPWSNGLGIGLDHSSNNIIARNEVTPSKGFIPWYGTGICAVELSNSLNNSIIKNSIRQNDEGIRLLDSALNNITENILANNMYGIHLEGSQYNALIGNNVTYVLVASEESNSTERIGYCGILIHYSYYSNLLRNNSIAGFRFNFGVEDGYCFQDIDISNTVDGKPIYYWVNRQGGQIPSDVGYVAIVNSTNVRLEGLDLKNNYQGILIAYSNGIMICNNNMTDNRYGIYFDSSTVCSNSTIYHNNFVNNTYSQVEFSAYGYPSANTWANGHPSGGNYWSDYEERYPNATELDGSGMWNTPYVIDENNTDAYPLVHPYVQVLGDVNDDRTVDIYDAILLGICFNSTPDDPHWNSNADFNNDSLIDIYDAIVLASNFGRTG